MLKHEDMCVGCPTEMGCLGSSCPMRNAAFYYCDHPGCDAYAEYQIDGEDYCEEHAEEYLTSFYKEYDEYADLDLYEMAEDNDISITRLD